MVVVLILVLGMGVTIGRREELRRCGFGAGDALRVNQRMDIIMLRDNVQRFRVRGLMDVVHVTVFAVGLAKSVVLLVCKE